MWKANPILYQHSYSETTLCEYRGSLCHVIQGGRSQERCHLVMMSYLHRLDSTLLQGCSSVHSAGCHTGRWSTPTPLLDSGRSGRRPFGTCLRHGTLTRWSCKPASSLERRKDWWWEKCINQSIKCINNAPILHLQLSLSAFTITCPDPKEQAEAEAHCLGKTPFLSGLFLTPTDQAIAKNNIF